MRFLLDVNILIALLDQNHLAHQTATLWFAQGAEACWHSTPTTQNAVIRIMSGTGYGEHRVRPQEAASLLDSLVAVSDHVFLPDDLSILNRSVINLERVRTGADITDTYLLALAVSHEVVFATMDRRIDPATVTGGESSLLVLE